MFASLSFQVSKWPNLSNELKPGLSNARERLQTHISYVFQPTETPPDTVKESAEDEKKAEKDKEEVEAETVEIKVTEEPDDTPSESKGEVQTDEAEKTDPGNFLDSIREEDEHSNYDLEGAASSGLKTDNKTSNLVENKRKLFSRQSSSASLKNRPNSVITGTDSIGDSGIETLDTNYGSEIRDQSEVFELSDRESESTNRESEKRARQRRKSRSRQDVYSPDEEDEDMIEPRHVHESLSRVSSMDSLEDDLKDVEEDNIAGKESAEDSEERTRNFVEQHMYVEVEPLMEESERERLNRADLLQKAILRRSVTQPNIIRYRSNIKRPKTAKPSVNGYSCSHIDIDLTCDAPPKADIKSKRLIQRSTTPRDNSVIYDKAITDHPMSIVDIGGVINANENLPDQYDLPKWPARPLTRPRSPTQKRLASAKERKTHHTNVTDDSATPRPPNRAQSAVPFLRENISRPVTPRRIIKRPQTAQIPYTKSKRMENAFSKFEKNDNLTVVVSEPFLNSDALYPNKTKFTTFHHGFKSIWPIGRKINVIQDKRPFSAFEMNSYSRAIERNELPFKKTCPTENVDPPTAREPEEIPEPEVKMLPTRKTLIKLELNTDGLKKPVGRNISTIIRTGFSPRSVTPGIVRL